VIGISDFELKRTRTNESSIIDSQFSIHKRKGWEMRKKRHIGLIAGLTILMITCLTVPQSNAELTSIGTAYSASISNIRHKATVTLQGYTGVRTLRLNLSWADADSIYLATGSWGAIADSVSAYVPTNIEPILLLGFWNPTKMDKPENARYTDVYKARDINEFRAVCYNLADALKYRVKYFVLHNEPNLFWDPDSGSRNWRNSIQDFADQCTAAAEAIKLANPDAYIIYGSFAGISHYGNGHENPVTKQFVDAIAPEGSPDPIIDGIDFHMYGDSLTQEQYYQVADSISAFCYRRNVDWIIGETAGPKIALPTDMPDPHNPDITIYDAMVLALENGGTLAELKDSLIVYTRLYDPNSLYLPENWSALEDAKIADFTRKITAFADSNATFGPIKIFSWLPAFVLPDLPRYQDPLPDSTDMEREMKLFLRGQTYKGTGLVYVDEEGNEYPTPFTERMKEAVAIYFPEVGVEEPEANNQITNHEGAISFAFSYPNPFNSTTEISYFAPFKSEVNIDIYNIRGERVASMDAGIQNSGIHSLIWNASGFASGTYFYKLIAGSKSITGSMVLIK